MAFEVAVGLRISEAEARAYPAHKLVERLEWLLEKQWGETTAHIAATQVGVTRAMAVSFSSKKGKRLPDLPTYEEVLRKQRGEQAPLPFWMVEFERANPGRALQIATKQVQHGD
jgi:hypothetical protein